MRIAAWGVIGVLLRYGTDLFVQNSLRTSFPVGTFLINTVGAFLIGLTFSLSQLRPGILTPTLRIGIMVGLLGGFTTFSSYCLDFVRLYQDNRLATAWLYLTLTPLIGVAATFLGMKLAQGL